MLPSGRRSRCSPRRARLCAALAAWLVFALTRLAVAADEPAPPTSAPAEASADARAEAHRLYASGELHYAAGEYEEAIANFREAYELSQAPALLYNLAQARRLNGECRKAIEAYHHFMRLVPDSPNRQEADHHASALEGQCPLAPVALPPAPAPVAALATPPPAVPASPGEERTSWTPRRKIAVGLLVAGLATGASGGALYLYNQGRYREWQTEDRKLRVPQDSPAAPADRIARLDRNDDLLRSIWRVDVGVMTLVSVSAACLVGSAIMGTMSHHPAEVVVGPRSVALSLSFGAF